MKYRTGSISFRHEITGDKILTGKYFRYCFQKNLIKSFGQNSYELLIEAKTEIRAQEAYELFISALALVEGHVVFPITELPIVFPYSSGPVEIEKIPFRENLHFFQQAGIYRAACIAARASFKKIHTYSLSKYLFACSQHSNYIIHLDPFHTEYQKLTRKPLDHIRYSFAILALYSVIEELGLEIRANEKNPSRLNGQWNPQVKDNLEKRLKQSKINLDKKALWNLRSRPTKIHPKDKLQLLGKKSWAKYYVRDSEIEIIDAISYTSWLRSKIIAHKIKDSFLSISIYDVANVNFLIRQMLLDILEPESKD
jgi:hypothetical protein